MQKDVAKDCKKIKIFHGKDKTDKMHRTFRNCLRMLLISKQIIVSLQAAFPDAEAQIVGTINFDDIENSVSAEIDRQSISSENIVHDWTAFLETQYADCFALL